MTTTGKPIVMHLGGTEMKKRVFVSFLALLLASCNGTFEKSERYNVTLYENEDFIILSDATQYVEKGGTAIFEVELPDGVVVDSLNYGYFDSKESCIIVENVQRHMSVEASLTQENAGDVICYDLEGGVLLNNPSQSKVYRKYDSSDRKRVNTLSAYEFSRRDNYTLTGWIANDRNDDNIISLGSRIDLNDKQTLRLYADWEPWTSSQKFTFRETDDGLFISKYTGNDEIITIPDKINGKKVIGIDSYAFHDLNSCKKVILNLSMRNVERYAFSNCSFSEFVMYDSVLRIYDDSFVDCAGFSRLRINAAEKPRLTNQWTSGWSDKFDRILTFSRDKTNKQMVFFAGSSMSYGLDSKMVDEGLDKEYKITNLGLSYLINPLLQFDALSRILDDNDILIHAPEDMTDVENINSFNNLTWRCLEENYDMLSYTDISKHIDVFDSFYEYNDARLALSEISYNNRTNEYDEYGDLSKFRENTDDTDKGYKTLFDADVLKTEILQEYDSIYKHFNDDLNIKVYFSYGPANLDGAKMPSQEKRKAYEDKVVANIHSAKIISTLEEYLYHGRYFSNTNFHLSTEGAKMRTTTLLSEIKTQMKKDGLL